MTVYKIDWVQYHELGFQSNKHDKTTLHRIDISSEYNWWNILAIKPNIEKL